MPLPAFSRLHLPIPYLLVRPYVHLGCVLIAGLLCRGPARAEEIHPRLFITPARLTEIRQAIGVTGSHHQEALDALREKVDQNDIRRFGATETNWNYARAYLAQSAAFLYQLTGEPRYATQAFGVVQDILLQPDPDRRGPDNNYRKTEPVGRGIDTNYGLSRATVGQGLTYAYDWCYPAWTETQRQFVKDHLNRALDAWETYRHANLESEHRGSNWVAVCRGGELVMLLAAYRDRQRPARLHFLKDELHRHIRNGYTPSGFTQEGIAYCAYAGLFLLPAVYALESTGDPSLREAIRDRHWWKWLMFAGSFLTKDGHPTVLQSGVAGEHGDGQGWPSLLLPSVAPQHLPYYLYFYDRYTGRKAPGTSGQKYEPHRAGTVWSLLYYPQSIPAVDPTGHAAFRGLADDSAGVYYFRNRWWDSGDVHLSLLADARHHSHAWDQAEALQLTLNGLGTGWISGPGKERNDSLFSTLLVDGRNHLPRRGTSHTGGPGRAVFGSDGGGYAGVSGGQKYDSLGVMSAKRHLEVRFAAEVPALLSVRDQVKSVAAHAYTVNLNLGKTGPETRRAEIGRGAGGHPEFTVFGAGNSQLRGWVVRPKDAQVQVVQVKSSTPAAGPWQVLQITTRGQDRDIWVVMALGEDLPPARIKAGSRKESFTLGKTTLSLPGTGSPPRY